MNEAKLDAICDALKRADSSPPRRIHAWDVDKGEDAKVGDTVKVIRGDHVGATGKVLAREKTTGPRGKYSQGPKIMLTVDWA